MAASIVAIVLSMLASQAVAGGFLELPQVTPAELESRLLSELQQALASQGTGHERLDQLQAKLKPMYEAVPKESDGTISHTVVRYVLHRFFAKHDGWFVRGLEPQGARNETEQGMNGVKEWIPEYLQSFLEKVLGGRGFSLRDLAICAATLEDFVHKEEHGWLKQVYGLLGHKLSDKLNQRQTQELVETYLMVYNFEGEFEILTPNGVRRVLANVVKNVTSWDETKAWFTKVIEDKWGHVEADEELVTTFDEMASLVKDVGERYGAFNDLQCLNMKNELVSVESRKPGRVKLSDFYRKSLHSTFEFNEKVDFLRDLGAIDESDPETPLVIVPNYVGSRTQCLNSSTYYALCCRNECEDLLGSLENGIKAPHASPSQIAKIVSALSSSTVPAPRVLSKPLLARLDGVATVNGGKVPLHGRLFAQWMHHAFPRECPYPHVGLTEPRTPDEWMKGSGQEDIKATEEEMLEAVRKDSCKLTPVGVECGKNKTLLSQEKAQDEHEEVPELPWTQDEELLVVRPPAMILSSSSPKRSNQYMRDLIIYVALSAGMSLISWKFKDPIATWLRLPVPENKKHDCYMI